MTNVARIQRINQNPYADKPHFQRIIIAPSGDLVIHAFGCAGKRNKTQRAVAKALSENPATITLNIGDIIYPTGLDVSGLNLEAIKNKQHESHTAELAKLRTRVTAWIKTIRDYLANIYSHPEDQSLHICATGNHEGGCEGLKPDTALKVVLAKLEAMPTAVGAYNQNAASLKIFLGDALQFPKFEFAHRFRLHEITRKDTHDKVEQVIITLDSSCWDLEQFEWLKNTVIPYLSQHPDVKIVLEEHHSPGFTTGRRAFDKRDAKKKYPGLPEEVLAQLSEPYKSILKNRVGNQHAVCQTILAALDFPFVRTVGAYAHEHTASAWTEAAFPDLPHPFPALNITAGAGGATSNRDDFALLVPESHFVNGTHYGFFSMQFPQNQSDTLKLSFIGQKKSENTAQEIWREEFNFQTLQQRMHQSNKLVTVPETYKLGQIKWYLTIISLLKAGQFDLIKYCIAANADYRRDTTDCKATVPGLLPVEVLERFFKRDFTTGAQTEQKKIEKLLPQLLELISFYINPQRERHCSLFLKQICLLYFLLKNALVQIKISAALTSNPLQLSQINFDSYFAATAPSPAKPTFRARLSQKLKSPVLNDDEDDGYQSDDEVDPRGLAEQPDSRRHLQDARNQEVAKSQASDNQTLTLPAPGDSQFNQAAFKKALQEAIQRYCLETKIDDVASYLRNPAETRPEIARLFLFYHLLESPNPLHNLYDIFRAIYARSSTAFKKLFLDCIGLNAITIFGNVLENHPEYMNVLRRLEQYATDSVQRALETKRVFIETWLKQYTKEDSALLDLFSSTALDGIGSTCKFTPSFMQPRDLLMIFFQNLCNYLNKVKPGFFMRHLSEQRMQRHEYCKKLTYSLIDALETAQTKRQLLQALADNATFENVFIFPDASTPTTPIQASHSFEDTNQVRTLKRTIEAILNALPEEQTAFAAVKTYLQTQKTNQDKKNPFELLREKAERAKQRAVQGGRAGLYERLHDSAPAHAQARTKTKMTTIYTPPQIAATAVPAIATRTPSVPGGPGGGGSSPPRSTSPATAGGSCATGIERQQLLHEPQATHYRT